MYIISTSPASNITPATRKSRLTGVFNDRHIFRLILLAISERINEVVIILIII